MDEIQMTFERYEIKYLLDSVTYRKLRNRLKNRMAEDAYGLTTICSVYYDTPDDQLIRRSLEKPVYKEKLRVRSYGEAGRESQVFVELKKKYRGIVYKRREQMPLYEAEGFLSGKDVPGKDSQVFREIAWFRDFYRTLRPAMYLAYDRAACCGTEDPSLRVTFDTRIRWRDSQLSVASPSEGKQLLSPGWYLMEIKTPGALPVWLCRILDELKIYPVSFSKYGRAWLEKCQLEKDQKNREPSIISCPKRGGEARAVFGF